jgi:hypothetical protein
MFCLDQVECLAVASIHVDRRQRSQAESWGGGRFMFVENIYFYYLHINPFTGPT